MTFVITDVLMFFSVGFVSFERMESADTAIAEVLFVVNKFLVNGYIVSSLAP